MKVASIFSGVGGFDLGFEAAGLEVVYQCESDPVAQSILRRHWPGIHLEGDVRNANGSVLNDLGADVLCGGFPCTDLSVAGNRKGLVEGEQSQLWFEFHRLIAEAGNIPFIVIENVPGLLSSNDGRDMEIILRGLEECRYGWQFRILDSQHHGVAQRRRRVFIIAYSSERCPPEILFESEGLQGDSEASRKEREGTAKRSGDGSQESDWGKDLANTIDARYHKGPSVGRDGIAGNIVPSVIDRAAFNQGENALYEPVIEESNTSPPIVARGPHAVMRGVGFSTYKEDTKATTLRAAQKKQTDVDLVLDDPQSFQWQASPNQTMSVTDKTPYLSTTKVPAIFQQNTRDEVRYVNGDGQLAGALAAHPGAKQQNYVTTHHPIAPTLFASGAGTERVASAGSEAQFIVGSVPRRLTPTECERLQAFPDDWTRYAEDGSEVADTHRYRMMGNAVTVSVAEWIGHRLRRAYE